MTSEIIIPSNPVDTAKILAAVKEGENSMLRIASEKEQLKSIIDTLHEDFPDIPAKYFRKLISSYYKQNIQEVEKESSDFVELYTSIVK